MNCPQCNTPMVVSFLLNMYDQEEASSRLEELLLRYSDEDKTVISKVHHIYEKTSLSYPKGREKSQIPTNHLYRIWDWIGFLDWCSQYTTEKIIKGMRWYLKGWSETYGFDRLLFSKLRNNIERVK